MAQLSEILVTEQGDYYKCWLRPIWGGFVLVYWNRDKGKLMAAVSADTFREAEEKMEKYLGKWLRVRLN